MQLQWPGSTSPRLLQSFAPSVGNLLLSSLFGKPKAGLIMPELLGVCLSCKYLASQLACASIDTVYKPFWLPAMWEAEATGRPLFWSYTGQYLSNWGTVLICKYLSH